ncbi:MAG: YfaP family protein [Sandaracinaceae bacterium]
MKRLVLGGVVPLLALVPALAGCHVRARAGATTASPASSSQGSVQVVSDGDPSLTPTSPGLQPGDGVTVVQPSCDASMPDVCGDGIDNNCNGVIDENCGWSGGNIQITLAWNTQADLDLYVTDPFGETISYQQRRSQSGGQLDVDARGQCGRGEERYTVENVFWDSPTPPSGTYQVSVHHYSACGTAGATQATV